MIVHKASDRSHADVEDGIQDADKYDGGNKIGRIGHHLHEFLEFHVLRVVQGQRQDDRTGRVDHQRVQGDHQRVPQALHKVVVLKETDEIIHSKMRRPGTAPDPVDHPVILKRHQQPVHGRVGKDQKHDQRRQDHQIQLPVRFHIMTERSPSGFLCFPFSLQFCYLLPCSFRCPESSILFPAPSIYNNRDGYVQKRRKPVKSRLSPSLFLHASYFLIPFCCLFP